MGGRCDERKMWRFHLWCDQYFYIFFQFLHSYEHFYFRQNLDVQKPLSNQHARAVSKQPTAAPFHAAGDFLGRITDSRVFLGFILGARQSWRERDGMRRDEMRWNFIHSLTRLREREQVWRCDKRLSCQILEDNLSESRSIRAVSIPWLVCVCVSGSCMSMYVYDDIYVYVSGIFGQGNFERQTRVFSWLVVFGKGVRWRGCYYSSSIFLFCLFLDRRLLYPR